MTEIPEHLLQRSRAAKAKAAGGGGDAPGGGEGGATGAAAPAPATSAVPTPAAVNATPAPVAEEKPPPPPSPMVQAYQSRRKIPFWAMPVLAALPVWAWIFPRTLEPPPEGEGPAALGTEYYGAQGCGGCHGSSGGGGVGPGFTGGAIYATWPKFQDHFDWVRLGSTGWKDERGDVYGANEKPVRGGMPGFAVEQISDADLLMLVYHERVDLGGENPDPADAALMEAAVQVAFEHPELTLEEILTEAEAAAGEAAAD